MADLRAEAARERARLAARERSAGDRATRSLWRDIGTAMEVERRRLPAARFARRAMGKAVLAAIGAIAVTGCKSPDQTASVLATLERGKARGHATLTTDGRLGVGQATTFWAGASGSTLAFDGQIDFSEGAQPPAGGQPTAWGQLPAAGTGAGDSTTEAPQ